MISPILSAPDVDTIQLDFGVFIAEHARTYRTSQATIIAALRPCITPSQPEETSQAHAPAADTPASQAAGEKTDGDGTVPAAPSVEPTPEAPKPLPDAPDEPAGALVQPAEAKTSEPADGGAVSAVKGANARLENAEGVEPPPSAPVRVRKLTARANIVSVHAEHPDWPSKLIAQHLGISEDAVRATASRKELKLVSWWDYQREQKAKTTEALRTPPASNKAPAAGKPSPQPELPPSAKSVAPGGVPSPFAPAEIGTPAKIRRPAKTRYYLREKLGQGQFLHMSGQGLTDKRIYAWIGTEQQLIAARKAFDAAHGLVEEVAE